MVMVGRKEGEGIEVVDLKTGRKIEVVVCKIRGKRIDLRIKTEDDGEEYRITRKPQLTHTP